MAAYGLAVAVPMSSGVPDVPGITEVAKNSTLVIVAVGSLALAVRATLAAGG